MPSAEAPRTKAMLLAPPPVKFRPTLRGGLMAPRTGTPHIKQRNERGGPMRKNPAYLAEIRRLARKAIAKAPDIGRADLNPNRQKPLSPWARDSSLPIGLPIGRQRHGGHESMESSQRTHASTVAAEEIDENGERRDSSIVGSWETAGHWIEYMSVRKWVADNELQEDLDRKAAGKQPKKKNRSNEEKRPRRKFTPVGGGLAWPTACHGKIRASNLFLRGCGTKPPLYTNPLEPRQDILIAAK